MDNTQAKKRGEHVIQPLANGTWGGSFDEFLLACRTAWCGGLFRTVGATGGVGYVS